MSRSTIVLATVLLGAAPQIPAASIVSGGPAPDAAEGIQQFGRLVGEWSCTGYQRGREGEWEPNPWRNRWTWHWVLAGHAVQDVWEGNAVSPAGWNMGTNIRVYDPEADLWRVAWTTTLTRSFDTFEARAVDGDMVMRGRIPERGQRPAHHARITFLEIGEDGFAWRYEASLTGEDGSYAEQARMTCTREG